MTSAKFGKGYIQDSKHNMLRKKTTMHLRAATTLVSALSIVRLLSCAVAFNRPVLTVLEANAGTDPKHMATTESSPGLKGCNKSDQN